MNYRTFWSILRQAGIAWNDDNVPRLGAALAFYSILSLAPLLVLMVAFFASVLGHPAAQLLLIRGIGNLIGPQGSDALKGMLQNSPAPASGRIASVIGTVALLFGASGVFAELQSALNTIWDVAPPAGNGVRAAVKGRLYSFGMLLAVGFLLLLSLLATAALAAADKFFSEFLPMPEFILSTIDVVISWAGTAVLFALIFRYVPAGRIASKDVRLGAAVTAFLFTLGKYLIGLYLGRAALGSAYGAAGSLVVLIVWVYYSALVFLFGAEFTHELNAWDRSHPPDGAKFSGANTTVRKEPARISHS